MEINNNKSGECKRVERTLCNADSCKQKAHMYSKLMANQWNQPRVFRFQDFLLVVVVVSVVSACSRWKQVRVKGDGKDFVQTSHDSDDPRLFPTLFLFQVKMRRGWLVGQAGEERLYWILPETEVNVRRLRRHCDLPKHLGCHRGSNSDRKSSNCLVR